MNAIEFFRLRYQHVHGYMTERLRTLSDEQCRQRVHGLNSVAWFIWHLARCEDVGVNRFVVDRPQVLLSGGWMDVMKVPRRDIGTGMTDDEVADLNARIDVPALWEYWAAVGRRTDEVIRDLNPHRLDEAVPRAHLDRVAAEEGIFGPEAAWVHEIWAGWPNRGEYLAQLALAHHYGHLYQAEIVYRRLTGERGR